MSSDTSEKIISATKSTALYFNLRKEIRLSGIVLSLKTSTLTQSLEIATVTTKFKRRNKITALM